MIIYLNLLWFWTITICVSTTERHAPRSKLFYNVEWSEDLQHGRVKVGTNRRKVFQGEVEAGHQLFQPFAEKGQQAIAYSSYLFWPICSLIYKFSSVSNWAGQFFSQYANSFILRRVQFLWGMGGLIQACFSVQNMNKCLKLKNLVEEKNKCCLWTINSSMVFKVAKQQIMNINLLVRPGHYSSLGSNKRCVV